MPENATSHSMHTSRRAILSGAPLAAAAAATCAWAASGTQMVSRPGSPETRFRTALHQEVDLAASPLRVYSALLSPSAFARFTGMPAEIDPHAGGAIWMFGGLIVGRNIELIPGKRIVQAWRAVQDFAAGIYSVVKMELIPTPSGTTLILDHTGFPEGDYGHLYAGWPLRYWNPLKKYLASSR
jgi:uncharacterized protein YndB with AHSA1/START domain